MSRRSVTLTLITKSSASSQARRASILVRNRPPSLGVMKEVRSAQPARSPGIRDLAGCCETPEQKGRTALQKPY